MTLSQIFPFFFFFNDTATTEIYTLSLHDALPIFADQPHVVGPVSRVVAHREQERDARRHEVAVERDRSEEHTSELQSPDHLVCRLLLEKKKNKQHNNYDTVDLRHHPE